MEMPCNNELDNNRKKQLHVNLQLQSLKYSYETLGNLLSSAENFAGLADEKYEAFNYSSSNDYNSLKSEFAWELECFNLALQTYQKKYGPYKFPPDCPKEKILKDIEKYIARTPGVEDKKLYFLMIDIINGKNVKTDFTNLYRETDENADKKFNPKKMVNIIGPVNQILDQHEKDAEEGNMNLFNKNRQTEYSKEQLKNIEKGCEKEVILGENGKLIIADDTLYFQRDINKIQLKIDTKEINLKKIKNKTFYSTSYGIIYTNQKYENGPLYSILFSLTSKRPKINENDITIIGKFKTNNSVYEYGIAKINKKLFDIIIDLYDL
jgi:hypothetical protein